MTERPTELGGRLRAVRLDAGLSQSGLSQLSGIPKPTLSRYENGHVSPSLSTLQRLASALGVPETSLLGPHTPDGVFLDALKEHGVTFGSVVEAQRLATSVATMLRTRSVAID